MTKLDRTTEGDLSYYKGRSRLLFLFGPKPDDGPYLRQKEEFSRYKPELEERDVVIFTVNKKEAIDPLGYQLNQEKAQALRDRFNVKENETVTILVGKDGNEKLRTNDLLDEKHLFKTIDSMPLRQQEIKERNSGL